MKALASLLLVGLCFATACANDLDEQWQLDHDRIIAIRATPPHVPSGQMSQLDVLVGHKGAPVSEQKPDSVAVVSPQSLASAASGSTITAPSEAQLASVREELALAPGAPVPLVVGISAAGFPATKTVWLGDSGDNPLLADLTVNGSAPPPATAIVVPPDQDVPLFVNADDAVDAVNWLTSCGTMHDFDLHAAYLHVEPDDPQQGQLGIVLRDANGGVTWQIWPIVAQ